MNTRRPIIPILALMAGLTAAAAMAETPAAPLPATEQPAPETKGKGLTRADQTKLRAAREKAETDPAVKEARDRSAAADKALAAAKKTGDKAAIAAADKTQDEAREAFVKARRAVIAKTDPDAASLDGRAYAAGERLRRAREAKTTKPEKPAETP